MPDPAGLWASSSALEVGDPGLWYLIVFLLIETGGSGANWTLVTHKNCYSLFRIEQIRKTFLLWPGSSLG